MLKRKETAIHSFAVILVTFVSIAILFSLPSMFHRGDTYSIILILAGGISIGVMCAILFALSKIITTLYAIEDAIKTDNHNENKKEL